MISSERARLVDEVRTGYRGRRVRFRRDGVAAGGAGRDDFPERARLVDEVTLMAVVASSTVQTNIFRF